MLNTQPASDITVLRMHSPALTASEARAAIRRINGRLATMHEEAKRIITLGLKDCFLDISKLYDNENYRVLGYTAWLDCVRAELPYLAKYQKSYANLIGHASVIHAGLLEVVNEQPLLDLIHKLPMSGLLGLEALPSPILQAAALQEAARMAAQVGPKTRVTEQMVRSAVSVVASVIPTQHVDTGDRQIPVTTAGVLVDYNEAVKKALEEARGRTGQSEYETVYMSGRIVKLPKTKRNFVVIELDDPDYALIAAQGVGGLLKASVRRKKAAG